MVSPSHNLTYSVLSPDTELSIVFLMRNIYSRVLKLCKIMKLFKSGDTGGGGGRSAVRATEQLAAAT